MEIYCEEITLKPWGSYALILEKPNYKVKRIVIKPNQRLSKQVHRKRDEYWIVVEGEGIITRDEDKVYCSKGYNIDIPRGMIHRAENLSDDKDFIFVEIQIGECKEEDIVRLEDSYGRN